MKHEYVGDIGDFANNGLLRFLCGITGPASIIPLRLGLVWYLNDDELEVSAGNRIEYLNYSRYNNRMYEICDPVLYRAEQKIVAQSMLNQQKRNIRQIMEFGILTDNTPQFPCPVPNRSLKSRNQWVQDALAHVGHDTDILFLNPDNGIDPKGKYKLKNVHLWEIKEFFRRGKSLVIYHHLGQGPEDHRGRIKEIGNHLINALSDCDPFCPAWLWVVRWKRVSTRAYFVVARTQEHNQRIRERFQAFEHSQWRKQGHFAIDISP